MVHTVCAFCPPNPTRAHSLSNNNNNITCVSVRFTSDSPHHQNVKSHGARWVPRLQVVVDWAYFEWVKLEIDWKFRCKVKWICLLNNQSKRNFRWFLLERKFTATFLQCPVILHWYWYWRVWAHRRRCRMILPVYSGWEHRRKSGEDGEWKNRTNQEEDSLFFFPPALSGLYFFTGWWWRNAHRWF